MVKSVRLGIIADQFCFELDVLFTILMCCRRNVSNCERCSELNKVIKHKLADSNLQHML